ncbi:MAG: glutaredoxin family protein [Chloroflexota bacterium]
MPHALVLYGKSDCHLCHAARDLLVSLQREFTFTFAEVDITRDASLLDKYRYDIPVIVIDGQLELSAPITEHELRAALQ